MPSDHARLSPSASGQWLNCPGSVALCENVVDTGGRDADEGTACHEALELALNGKPVSPGYRATNGIVITAEHLKLVQQVLDYIDQYRHDHPGAVIFSEKKIEIGSLAFGLPEGAMFGTVDVTGMSKDELLILDAKFGYVSVPVKKNPQLVNYALGTLYYTAWMFDRVRLVIAQPKVGEPKEIVYTAAEMQAFEDEFKPKVWEAYKGGPLRPTTTLPPGNDADPCRWCKAQAVCPALNDELMALAAREMADPLTLAPEDISVLLLKGAAIENALRAIRAHALKLMELGTEIPGWKRVQGDKHRAWFKTEQEVATKMIEQGVIDPYERSLKSPAQIEEALITILHKNTHDGELIKTKKRAKEVAKAIVAKYANKPPGEPTLARDSDERPALPPAFTAEELAGHVAAKDAVVEVKAEEVID